MKKIIFILLFFVLLINAYSQTDTVPKQLQEKIAKLYSEGDYTKAKKIIDSFVIYHPKSPASYNLLGIWYYTQGIEDTAFNYFKQALSIDSTYANAYINIGNIFFSDSDYTTAAQYFEKGYLFSPDSLIYAFYSGVAFLADSNYQKAHKYLKIALNSKDPKTKAKLYYFLANYYYERDSIIKAVSYIDSSLNIFPLTDAYYLLSSIYYRLGNYKKALSAIDSAISLRRNFYDYYMAKIKILQSINLNEEALKVCKNAEAYINSPNLYDVWATLYYGLKDMDSALFILNVGIKKYPNSPLLHFDKYLIHVAKKQYEPALTDISQAINLDSTNLKYRIERSKIRLIINTPSEILDDNNFLKNFDVKHYKRLLSKTQKGKYKYKKLHQEFINDIANWGIDKFLMLIIGGTKEASYDTNKIQFIDNLLANMYEKDKYDACIKQATIFEKKYPYILEIYYYKALSLFELNQYSKGEKELYKYLGFIYAIGATGNGKVPQEALIVSNPLDETFFINYFDLGDIKSKQSKIIDNLHFDVIKIRKDINISEIYFFTEFFKK